MKKLVAAVECISGSEYPATPRLPTSQQAVTTPSQLMDMSMSWDYYDMRPIPTPGRELEF